MYKKSIYFTFFILMLTFFSTSPVHAYTIVWVSDWTTGTGQPAQWDKGWADLLTSQGYTVNNTPGRYWRTLDATKLATLDAADLIIISRDSTSGEYDDGTMPNYEPYQWNSVKTPLILLTVYIARSSHWRWFDTTSLTADGDAPICGAVLTTHPIFNGVTLDASNRVDVLDETVGTGNTSFVNIATAGNGTVIATRPTASNNVWIAEWSPGQRFYSAAAYPDGTPAIAGARRMLFIAGTREGGSFGQGMYNLTPEGQKMFLNAVNYMITYKQLKAYSPNPANGTKDIKPSSLTWAQGDTAVAHNVYFGTDLAAIEDADTSSPEFKEITSDPQHIIVTELLPSTTYYWRIDEVEEGGTAIKGDIWNFSTPPLKAYNPSPLNGARWQDPGADLTWSPGFKAKPLGGQDVYFGTDAASVTNAATSNPLGVFKGNQSTRTYDPGPLALNTFYYWRIDERNTDNTVTKGDVWLFKTTVPGLGTILRQIWENITPTGTALTLLYNWPLFPDSPTWSDQIAPYDSPDHTPNLEQYGGRMHGWLYPPLSGDYIFYLACDDNGELLLSSDDDPANASRIAFVSGYTGYQNWNDPEDAANQKSAAITLNADKRYYISALWKQGTGGDHCSVGWTIPGATNITVISGIYLAPYMQYWAYSPTPANNATGVEQKPTLIWKPGVKTLKHNVYFGGDQTAVANANTSTAGIYKGQFDVNEYPVPTDLNLGQTYYWRIDEVNGLDIWPGRVWNFSVADYLVVEDYEKYTNSSPDIIWQTWIAGGGGKVGYNDPNYIQTYLAHGGDQSMPFDYSNLNPPHLSEATRTFAATDFTKYGVKALSLWTRGYGLPVGSCVQSPPGTYTMTASGTDIWNVPDIRHPSTFHDEFHYAYTQVSGDCVIIAKVESVSNTNGWAKAGVMMRDSLDANSPHAMMCMTPGNGAAFQYRLLTGGTSTNGGQDPNVDAPYWLAVQRVGNVFTGAYCADGVSWAQLGPQIDLVMADPIYIGLSLTSHNVTATCVAVFSNVTGLPTFTNQDIGIKSNTAAPLYVTLQDSSNTAATVTHKDPNVVLNSGWREWNIALGDFIGVNKTAITKLTIGVGNKGTPAPVGVGTIYVDDIRLYIPRCLPNLQKPFADFTNDCLVDYYDLDILTNNWLISTWDVTPQNPGITGLAARYQFEGDLTDSSGNGHNGDPCGTTPTYAAGKIGQALIFSGDDYIYLGNSFNLPLYSVALWFRVDGGTGSRDLFTAFTTNHGVLLEIQGAGTLRYLHRFPFGTSGGNNIYTTVGYADGLWHHAAAVKSADRMVLYVDGLQVGAQTDNTQFDQPAMAVLGRIDNTRAERYFTGAMDEVRIYNRVLSQNEVAYLAGWTESFKQPISTLLTPQDRFIDLNGDGVINLLDYRDLANEWLLETEFPFDISDWPWFSICIVMLKTYDRNDNPIGPEYILPTDTTTAAGILAYEDWDGNLHVFIQTGPNDWVRQVYSCVGICTGGEVCTPTVTISGNGTIGTIECNCE